MLASMEVRSGRPGRGRSVANGRDLAFHHIGVVPVGLVAGSPYGAQRACGVDKKLQLVASSHVLAAENRERRRKLDIVGAAGGSNRNVRARARGSDDVAIGGRQGR